jgi:oligoribonuclease NrnB/cAMP/cGMP phosphodiesterase (DHH superfamily)
MVHTAVGMINMMKTHMDYVSSLRVILFTHDDMDGSGPAIIAKKFFGDRVKVVHCSNDTVNNKIQKFMDKKEYENYDLVFIADISVNEELAKQIDNLIRDKVFLFDHHQTALNLAEYDWAEVVVKYHNGKAASGTSLFYDFMRTHYDIPKCDHFVDLIRQYDTWEWFANNNLDAKRLANLFSIYGLSEFVRRYTSLDISEFEFSEVENQILDMEAKRIQTYMDEACKSLMPYEFDGYKVAVTFAELYTSELGNYICNNHPEYDLALIINLGRSVSLRTVRDDVDVSAIAKKFGGGGHRKASGFPIPTGLQDEVIKKILNVAL